MATFTPQLTIPSATDKYFIRLAYGGYSPCIAGKPLRAKGSALDNCVALCWGLAAKREGNLKCDIGVPPARLKQGKYNPTSAQLWTKYANGRKVDKTPELGAIIVYEHTNGSGGHVMSIEEIGKNYVIAVGSGYGTNGYLFRKEKLPLSLARKNCKLLGVIHLKAKQDTKPTKPTVPTITYKVGDKVKITAKGNTRADGKGKASGGIGWTRQILAIYPNQPYPLKIGNAKKVLTGYYKTTGVKKV